MAGVVLGTAKLVISGGTWDSTSTGRTGNAIDLAGTVTVSGTVAVGAGTLTYVSGTITTTSSTLSVTNNSTTFATNGVTWNNVTLLGGSATYTFNSAFAWSGTLTLSNAQTLAGAGPLSGTGSIVPGGTTLTITVTGGMVTTGTMSLPNAAITFAGTAGFTVGTLTTITLNATRTTTLTFGNTYNVTAAFSNVGTTATIRQAFVSSSAGNKVVLTLYVGATMDLAYADPTDIDSSAGQTVATFRGVITTTLNWSTTLVAANTGSGAIFVL